MKVPAPAPPLLFAISICAVLITVPPQIAAEFQLPASLETTAAELKHAHRQSASNNRTAQTVSIPGGEFSMGSDEPQFTDGYISTSPVRSFPPNSYGLYDMAGNAWEWTSDWYRPDYYQTLAATGKVAQNPRGPSDSFDPSEPGIPKRVQRGGSFLCTNQYCSRYSVGARGRGVADTGTNHVGFRCVYD